MSRQEKINYAFPIVVILTVIGLIVMFGLTAKFYNPENGLGQPTGADVILIGIGLIVYEVLLWRVLLLFGEEDLSFGTIWRMIPFVLYLLFLVMAVGAGVTILLSVAIGGLYFIVLKILDFLF